MYCTKLPTPVNPTLFSTPLPVCTSSENLVSIGKCMAILEVLTDGQTKKKSQNFIYRFIYCVCLFITMLYSNNQFKGDLILICTLIVPWSSLKHNLTNDLKNLSLHNYDPLRSHQYAASQRLKITDVNVPINCVMYLRCQTVIRSWFLGAS